jgi:LacI family transcriptional regulator
MLEAGASIMKKKTKKIIPSSCRKRHPLRVALQIVEHDIGRQMLEGIIRYNREHDQWEFFWDRHGDGDFSGVDAVIAEGWDPGRVRRLRRLRMPVVAATGYAAEGHLPLVVSDNRAVGRLAGDHFRELGLKQWAYFGAVQRIGGLRREGFIEVAEQCGASVQGLDAEDFFGLTPAQREARLAEWISCLPRPCAIFAIFGFAAQIVATVCHVHGIRVPDEMAILGVGRNDIYSQLSNPPLSTVDPNAEAIGYQAAALLDRILSCKERGRPTVLVPPLGIVRYQSTDIFATDCPEVVQALRLIRQEACDGLTPEDVAERTSISRTGLERLFRRWVGRSLHQHIVWTRMERAKLLLGTTKLSALQIALRCGLSYPSQLSRLFKLQYGLSPTQYRHQQLFGLPDPSA